MPAIAAMTPSAPMSVITEVAEATAAITRFDAEHGDALAPFAALLLRSESAASSQIENLTASAKAILTAELGVPARTNASLIVANTRAMEAALSLTDQLDEPAIIAMHKALLVSSRPEWTGRWRQEQVWIGGSPWGPHTALFVPPHHDDVPDAMADLAAFMRRDDLPPLLHAALAHAQFETIHPFPDGNGRVGRTLINALLRSQGVTRGVTVPVSAGLLRERDAYFDALGRYRVGDPVPIIERFTEATFLALDSATVLIHDLQEVRVAWGDAITARAGATAWRLAEILLGQPVINSAIVQERLDVSAPTANGAIAHLVEAEILVQSGGGRRDRRWAAPHVLEVLDAFAEWARRP